MKKNQIDQGIQYSESKSNQQAPEKNKDIQKKKPAEHDPYKNDPTRKDKPPFIISKL